VPEICGGQRQAHSAGGAAYCQRGAVGAEKRVIALERAAGREPRAEGAVDPGAENSQQPASEHPAGLTAQPAREPRRISHDQRMSPGNQERQREPAGQHQYGVQNEGVPLSQRTWMQAYAPAHVGSQE